MDGSELRSLSILGNSTKLKEIFPFVPNPCSCDEYSLSALHYAVWNGHTECVKLLVANPKGVDRHGKRTSLLNMQSCMGFTGIYYIVNDYLIIFYVFL